MTFRRADYGGESTFPAGSEEWRAKLPTYTTVPELAKHMNDEHGGAPVGGAIGDILDRHDMLHGTTDCGHDHLSEQRFAPDQPRDDHGRWEGGGGPEYTGEGGGGAWEGTGKWTGDKAPAKQGNDWGKHPAPTATSIAAHMKTVHGETDHFLRSPASQLQRHWNMHTFGEAHGGHTHADLGKEPLLFGHTSAENAHLDQIARDKPRPPVADWYLPGQDLSQLSYNAAGEQSEWRRGDYDARSAPSPRALLEEHMRADHGGMPAGVLDLGIHHKRLHERANVGHVHHGEAAGGVFASKP